MGGNPESWLGRFTGMGYISSQLPGPVAFIKLCMPILNPVSQETRQHGVSAPYISGDTECTYSGSISPTKTPRLALHGPLHDQGFAHAVSSVYTHLLPRASPYSRSNSSEGALLSPKRFVSLDKLQRMITSPWMLSSNPHHNFGLSAAAVAPAAVVCTFSRSTSRVLPVCLCFYYG